MNSLPKFEFDKERRAIDLEGLEAFLVQTDDAGSKDLSAFSNEESETQTVLRLLDQLYKVGELVRETSEKLVLANERLVTLSSQVAAQNKQMELLAHYQAQAARIGGLEHSLAMISAENERLKASRWRKIFFWIK
jgi:cell division septal protein FtsQ